MSAAILGNDVFQLAVWTKALPPLPISRYLPAMSYGSHVDDALNGGMRSDILISKCSANLLLALADD